METDDDSFNYAEEEAERREKSVIKVTSSWGNKITWFILIRTLVTG